MRPTIFLTDKLLKDKIITKEQAEIAQYGFQNLESSLLGVTIILIISGFFDCISEGIILCIFFFPLRRNAGGFHAETRINCFIVSTIIVTLGFLWFKKIEWFWWHYTITSLFLGAIIFFMSPIENTNKHLDAVENKIYRQRTILILAVESIAFVLAILMNWENLCKVVIIAYFIVDVSLIAGKIKLRMCKKENLVET